MAAKKLWNDFIDKNFEKRIFEFIVGQFIQFFYLGQMIALLFLRIWNQLF